MKNKSEKNYGIELLRVISMIYVMLLHGLGRGGILSNAETGTMYYYVSWFLQVLAYPAVNIFALISGYVSYKDSKSGYNIRRYISLWLQVVFYDLIIAIISNAIHPDLVAKKDILLTFFPVNKNMHWYFTAYTGLIILKPILDGGVREIENSKLFFFLTLIILSIFDSFSNIFNMNDGYSLLWISILYVIGAIIKKEKIEDKVSCKNAIVIILVMHLFTYLWKVMYGRFISVPLNLDGNFFVNKYNSPTIMLIGIAYVILFAKIRISEKFHGLISFFSKNCFSAYIINTNRFIYGYIIADLFVLNMDKKYILILLIIYAVLFVVVSVLIDKLRDRLFKVFKIK